MLQGSAYTEEEEKQHQQKEAKKKIENKNKRKRKIIRPFSWDFFSFSSSHNFKFTQVQVIANEQNIHWCSVVHAIERRMIQQQQQTHNNK